MEYYIKISPNCSGHCDYDYCDCPPEVTQPVKITDLLLSEEMQTILKTWGWIKPEDIEKELREINEKVAGKISSSEIIVTDHFNNQIRYKFGKNTPKYHISFNNLNNPRFYAKIPPSTLKDINPELYKEYQKATREQRKVKEKKEAAAKKRRERKKQKELEKAKKLLEEAGEI